MPCAKLQSLFASRPLARFRPARPPIQITGRSHDGKLTVEVDGRPATLKLNKAKAPAEPADAAGAASPPKPKQPAK